MSTLKIPSSPPTLSEVTQLSETLIESLKRTKRICVHTKKLIEYALRLGLNQEESDTQLMFCSLEQKAQRYLIQQLLDAKIKKILKKYSIGDRVSCPAKDGKEEFAGTIVRVKNTKDIFGNDTIAFVVQRDYQGSRKSFRLLDIFTLEHIKITGHDHDVSGFHNFCTILIESIKHAWGIEKPENQATISVYPSNLNDYYKVYKESQRNNSQISMEDFITALIDQKSNEWHSKKTHRARKNS